MKNKFLINSFFRTSFLVISKLLALITIPLIARILGPEKFGQYNLIFAILNYALLFVNFGFVAYGTREVAKGKQKQIEITIFNSRLFYSIIVFILSNLIVIVLSFFNLQINLLIFFIAFLKLFSDAIKLDFYFYGQNNFLFPSLTSIIGQLFFFLFIIYIFPSNPTVLILITIYVLYNFIDSLLLLIRYKLTKKMSLINFNPKLAVQLFIKNFPLGFGSKTLSLILNLPIIFVAFYYTEKQLGTFTAPFKLYVVFSTFTQTVLFPAIPYLVRKFDNKEYSPTKLIRSLYLIFAFGVVLGCFLYFIHELKILNIFGDQYLQSVQIFKYITLFLFPLLPLNYYLILLINSYGADKQFMNIAIIQLLIFILLSFIFGSSSLTNMVLILFCTQLIGIIYFVYYLFFTKRVEFNETTISN